MVTAVLKVRVVPLYVFLWFFRLLVSRRKAIAEKRTKGRRFCSRLF